MTALDPITLSVLLLDSTVKVVEGCLSTKINDYSQQIGNLHQDVSDHKKRLTNLSSKLRKQGSLLKGYKEKMIRWLPPSARTSMTLTPRFPSFAESTRTPLLVWQCSLRHSSPSFRNNGLRLPTGTLLPTRSTKEPMHQRLSVYTRVIPSSLFQCLSTPAQSASRQLRGRAPLFEGLYHFRPETSLLALLARQRQLDLPMPDAQPMLTGIPHLILLPQWQCHHLCHRPRRASAGTHRQSTWHP